MICVYGVIMNKYNYYPVPIEKVSVCAYNPFIEMDKGAEAEYYYALADYQEPAEDLLNNIDSHRLAYYEGEKIDCEYKYCHKHGTQHVTIY